MSESVVRIERAASKGAGVRFASAAFANLVAQGASVVIQLASVSLFVATWSLERYGDWLLLAAVPTYFALADVGFLGVTINKMSIVAASGDSARTNVLFQTAIKLCLFACAAAMVLVFAFLSMAHFSPIDSLDNKLALACLVASALMAMSSGLFDAVFRSQGEFALGTHLVSFTRLTEWVGMILGLTLGGTFLSTAAGQLAGRAVAMTAGCLITRRRHPGVKWGIGAASSHEMRKLAKPAIAFMAFPVANAVSIQGMVIVVGHLFGGAFLATFNTYRTVSRVSVQAVAILSRSLWPEISRRYGLGDKPGVLNLYRRGTLASICVALGLCAGLALVGDLLVGFWTSGKIPFSGRLFALFLIATTLTSAWQMGLVTLSATNTHASLSLSYLAASLLPMVLTFVLRDEIGGSAPVFGLIAGEIALMFACFFHMRTFARRWETSS